MIKMLITRSQFGVIFPMKIGNRYIHLRHILLWYIWLASVQSSVHSTTENKKKQKLCAKDMFIIYQINVFLLPYGLMPPSETRIVSEDGWYPGIAIHVWTCPTVQISADSKPYICMTLCVQISLLFCKKNVVHSTNFVTN